MGICIALAIPAFEKFHANMRLEAYARSLVLDLNYARIEAMKLKQNVFICPSDDLLYCSRKAAKGYIIGFESANKIKILKTKALAQISFDCKSALKGNTLIFTAQGLCPFQGSLSIQASQRLATIVITHSGRARFVITPASI
jgi:Tfp pilus assembly protein FimT